VHLLPTLWFRNTWSWGREGDGYSSRPELRRAGPAWIVAEHRTLGRYELQVDSAGLDAPPELLFTENETNLTRLYGAPNPQPFVKDAMHRAVVEPQARPGSYPHRRSRRRSARA
jgi:hypothetical protein